MKMNDNLALNGVVSSISETSSSDTSTQQLIHNFNRCCTISSPDTSTQQLIHNFNCYCTISSPDISTQQLTHTYNPNCTISSTSSRRTAQSNTVGVDNGDTPLRDLRPSVVTDYIPWGHSSRSFLWQTMIAWKEQQIEVVKAQIWKIQQQRPLDKVLLDIHLEYYDSLVQQHSEMMENATHLDVDPISFLLSAPMATHADTVQSRRSHAPPHKHH